MEKTCFRCGVLQPLTEFYKHKGMADGHLNKCKTCTKGDSNKTFHTKKHIPEWKESEKKRAREKFHRLGYRGKYKPSPERKKEIMGQYWERYPEKKAAHIAMGNQSVRGMELHHWSYNEEHYTCVIALTNMDHNRVHRCMEYDQEHKMYRTKVGVLLDTRELHEQFINEILNDPSTL
jgi:hypothetical protein